MSEIRKNITKYTVLEKDTIRKAIRKMDEGGIGFITCVDGNDKVVGVVTDGDFRRAILRGINLENGIGQIANKDFYFLETGYKSKEAEDIFEDTPARHIPVLDNGKLVDIVIDEEFFKIEERGISRGPKLNLPVVIMGGGKGTRLDPFTRILPKALIPIGEKPIIEVIMDEYAKYGMKDFFISVNHKSKMIKAYFEDLQERYNIYYIDEDKPLGTAGALKYLEGKFSSSFFVSNCDIIIKGDYSKIYKFHKEGKYSLTLVASMQHHTIPYGVCEIKNGGELEVIREKPEYDFLVNAGMYLLEPEVLKFIPETKFYHMTHLIENLQQKGKNIGVYPVSEKSWIDVGQWSKYNNNVSKILTNYFQ